MLVYAEKSAREALAAATQLDRQATKNLATTLFPGEELEPLADGDLTCTCPPDSELYMGRFTGVSVVAAKEFAGDYPSKLPASFLAASGSGMVYLHAMHSVVDWFAYAVWLNGTLQRALSLSPDSGIIEDIGQRLPFEETYWAGKHPVDDSEDGKDGKDGQGGYPLPFHPLELGEAALQALFGYELEGVGTPAATLFLPESVPLMRFKRSRSKRKFW